VAVRFYLPSAGTSPLPTLAVAPGWTGSVAAFARGPAGRTKSNVALANRTASFLSSASRADCWGQWASEPLTEPFSFTTAHTASLVVRGLESNSNVDGHLAYVVRVVSGDGATVRGTLVSRLTQSTEYGTSAATRIHSANAFTANVNALAGDRIVIEVGGYGVTPNTGGTLTLCFGDPAATADFALTANLTTDLVPWLELSATPNFDTVSESGGAGFSLAAAGAGHLGAAESGSAALSAAAIGSGHLIAAAEGAATAAVSASAAADVAVVVTGTADMAIASFVTTDVTGFVSAWGTATLELAAAGSAALTAAESGAADSSVDASGVSDLTMVASGGCAVDVSAEGAAVLTLQEEGAASAGVAASGSIGLTTPAAGAAEFAVAAEGAWALLAGLDGGARFFVTASNAGELGFAGGITPHLLQTHIMAPGVLQYG